MANWKPFRTGLGKTREAIARLLARPDGALLERIEEALLGADLGPQATERILKSLAPQGPHPTEDLRRALVELAGPRVPLQLEGSPAVIVLVGVNGSGKTTTLGKLAVRFGAEGKRVLVAAGDTFRAAAVEQVREWADRAGAQVVAQEPGADAAAVAYDALEAALARRVDVLLVDTAGRLQNRTPLMAELQKVLRVLERRLGRPVDEVLLVLDGNTGQNALMQGRAFMETVPLTGLVVTKLDASAKGGAVLVARQALGVPVKLVGLGEREGDLAPFDPEAYVQALIGDL